MIKTGSITDEYFKEAKDWYADRYESVSIQANRWFVGFITSMALCVALLVAMIFALSIKNISPAGYTKKYFYR